MTALTRYLDDIVEPTFEDFKRNPRSLRHAYLACLVTYHAIGRVTYPKNPGNLRKQWKKTSVQFAIVDMIYPDSAETRTDRLPIRLTGILLAE